MPGRLVSATAAASTWGAEWFVHSTDANRAYSMHNKLRIAD
jgi:hypothetical protein